MSKTSPSQPKNPETWPRKITTGRVTVKIYKRLTPAGHVGFRVENYSTGKRNFDSYKNEADAMEAANKLARQLSQMDTISASMTKEQCIEYASIVQSLQPLGLTPTAAVAAIVEAVEQVGSLATVAAAIRFFKLKHKAITQKSVADVITELLAVKKSRGAAARYIGDLEFRLPKFADAFKCDISSVTTAAVQDWLDNQKLSTQTYANNRRAVHLLFSFAVSRNYAHDNIVSPVEKVKIKNGDIEVFTPDEARKLLASAPEDFLPCLALGLFAGIRSAEIERLKWQDIDLKQGHIVVGKSAAKTASRRPIPIEKNLALWLAPYAERTGKIWTQKSDLFYTLQKTTAKAAGIEWKQNAMRHSFISYSFAIRPNAGEIAGICGTSQQMIHRHYRQLVSKADAAEFFAINPPKLVGDAIPPMLEAAAS